MQLTSEGKRVAAAYFEKHARDLEDLMSMWSEKEKQQVYASLKKLGLLAQEKLGGRASRYTSKNANRLDFEERITDMKSRKGTRKKSVKGPTTSGNPSPRPTGPSPEEIRLRAYEIYIERGCTGGRELDDWLQAEKELVESLRKRDAGRSVGP